jgi:hypothetical protein
MPRARAHATSGRPLLALRRFELGQGLHTQGAGRVELRLHVLMRGAERLPVVAHDSPGPPKRCACGRWPWHGKVSACLNCMH